MYRIFGNALSADHSISVHVEDRVETHLGFCADLTNVKRVLTISGEEKNRDSSQIDKQYTKTFESNIADAMFLPTQQSKQ